MGLRTVATPWRGTRLTMTKCFRRARSARWLGRPLCAPSIATPTRAPTAPPPTPSPTATPARTTATTTTTTSAATQCRPPQHFGDHGASTAMSATTPEKGNPGLGALFCGPAVEPLGQLLSPAAINEHEGDIFGEHELGTWCSLSVARGAHGGGGDLYWGALDQMSTGCDQPPGSRARSRPPLIAAIMRHAEVPVHPNRRTVADAASPRASTASASGVA